MHSKRTVELSESAVKTNPLTKEDGSFRRGALVPDEAASIIQAAYRGHTVRMYKSNLMRLDSAADIVTGIAHGAGDVVKGALHTSLTGAIAHNLQGQNLKKNILQKYLNLSWYAKPLFLLLHTVTAIGAFPWIFILTTKQSLAGQSTAKHRDTFSAILWACGYPVNCAIVLGLLYKKTGLVVTDINSEQLEMNRAFAAGYIGWALSMWTLLVARALLNRWPNLFGGMFNENPQFDFSYVTVVSGPFRGEHGRVMSRSMQDSSFRVKLGTRAKIRPLRAHQLQVRLFEKGIEKAEKPTSNAGSVMIKHMLQIFDVNVVDAGRTGYWSFCLLSLVLSYICFFFVYYFSKIRPRIKCEPFAGITTCPSEYPLLATGNSVYCCKIIDDGSAVEGVFDLSGFVTALGGSAVSVYAFVKIIARILVTGDSSVSTAEENAEAIRVLQDQHELKQDRVLRRCAKRFDKITTQLIKQDELVKTKLEALEKEE